MTMPYDDAERDERALRAHARMLAAAESLIDVGAIQHGLDMEQGERELLLAGAAMGIAAAAEYYSRHPQDLPPYSEPHP